VRKYFLVCSGQCGAGSIEKLITSLRVFLRHVSAQGLCKAGLDKAVPAYASWRLAELPKHLTAEQVNALIAACDGDSPARRRDRAILLLLSRLGLRAGDVARLRLGDIEWWSGAAACLREVRLSGPLADSRRQCPCRARADGSPSYGEAHAGRASCAAPLLALPP
jgi:integrase